MKKLLLLSIMNLCFWNINAQTCMADSMYADSSAGVFPAPITMENPDGGIDRAACIGEYYEYALTVVIPDSATFFFGGFPIVVDIISAQIETEGAVQGLPSGIDYLCMPVDCIYPSESSGCILLYGTVEEGVMPGRYPLFIELQVTVQGLGTLDITFPGTQFPGQYFLDVAPSDSSICTSPAIHAHRMSNKLYPNPVLEDRIVKVEGYEEVQSLILYSMEGQTVQQFENCPASLNLNGLATGMYLAVFREKDQQISYQKIWVSP